MPTQQQSKQAMSLDGGTRRLKRDRNTTGEESCSSKSSYSQNDGKLPNPQGGVSPERSSSKNAAHRLKGIKIGTWNVRTMYDTGKLHLLAKEMTRLNCNICGLAETRWSGNGHFTTLGGTHTMSITPGSREGGNKGVAFIIDKETAKSISGYNPIKERIISIRINCKPFPVTIIQVYAPTSDADDEDIEYFYDQIEKALSSSPKMISPSSLAISMPR